jgi:hypothetical protein
LQKRKGMKRETTPRYKGKDAHAFIKESNKSTKRREDYCSLAIFI